MATTNHRWRWRHARFLDENDASNQQRLALRRASMAALSLMCIVFAVAGPTLAHAADEYVTACGHTCQPSCISGSTTCHQAVGGKCKLNSNLSCDATESPIMLDSGLDLDLRGYDITCTETLPSTCNYAAISFDPNDTGSVVTSDGTAGESVISGPFYSGVDCDLAAGSVVENTTVFDALFGVLDCKTVKNNVIGPTTQNAFGGNWGIALTAQISSGDAITGNFVSGRVVPIAATHASATVQGNVVDTDGAVLGISVGTSAGGYTGQARYNVFFGEGLDSSSDLVRITGTSSGTYSGNLCDPDHPGCASCIANTRCTPYVSPFPGN